MHKNKTQANQKGFASIIIAILLVLILSLITVGFAQLMRSEQRQALDKQLSSQAYYAAESGINVATKAIDGGYTGSKKDCKPINSPGSSDPVGAAGSPEATHLSSSKVSDKTGSSFPCLLINQEPNTLEFSPVKTTEPTVVQMQAKDNAGHYVGVSTISISWSDAAGGKTFANNCDSGNLFPATGSGNIWADGNKPYTGLLRTQLIPAGGSLKRADLINSTYTAFLCPNAGGGTAGSLAYPSNAGTNSGAIIKGNCNESATPRHCNVNITGLGALNQTTYFLAMRSIYRDTGVTIRLYGGNGDTVEANQLNIAGAQILIDSTGKAQDVVRRVQVRVAAHNTYDLSDGSGSTGDLCKQLKLEPATATIDAADCRFP